MEQSKVYSVGLMLYPDYLEHTYHWRNAITPLPRDVFFARGGFWKVEKLEASLKAQINRELRREGNVF